MKLAKYLADYIEYEIEKHSIMDVIDNLDIYIQQGIEAFESTEAVKVLVVSEETAERVKELSECEIDEKGE